MIANDPEVDIVVEVMGGVEPAYTFTKRALEAGKRYMYKKAFSNNQYGYGSALAVFIIIESMLVGVMKPLI